MRELRLSTVGAVCALIAVAGFAAGVALMATNGVSVLIPETGKEGAEWVADVQDAGNWLIAGAWIGGLAGLVGIVALVGFYDVLKHAGPVMIIAPVAGAVGLTLVTASHVIPIAMAQELAPSYTPETPPPSTPSPRPVCSSITSATSSTGPWPRHCTRSRS